MFIIDSSRDIPECIVGFSLGMRKESAGAVNEALGMEVNMFLSGWPRPVPLILQHEIASCVNGPRIMKAKVIEKHRDDGAYLDTREVGVQAWLTMRENGWKTCVVLAHKDHAERCAAVMRKLGAVVTGTITTNVYDRLSTQWWTTYRFLFVPANAYAMYKYRKKGWI